MLTRKAGESVCVGPALEVRVLAVRGNRVKLGFWGPPEIVVQRSEIREVARLANSAPAQQPAVTAGDVEPLDATVV